MEKFQFVTISHPDEIRDEKNQSQIRKHAIRSSLRKSRDGAEQRRENFVAVQVATNGHDLKMRQIRTGKVPMVIPPSSARADPFDALPGCPDRLRVLMGHKSAKQASEPVFCVGDSGQIFSQGMESVSQGAFTDPALLHALSLVLALAANKDVANLECLNHRGETLRNLAERMGDMTLVPKVSTLTAMLVLIGYEYRVNGSSSHAISLHIRAIDEVIKMSRKANVAVSHSIRRALFWQDLFSCLFVRTTRLLSHKNYPEFCWARDHNRSHTYVVPSGFLALAETAPIPFSTLLQDLNALCILVDSSCDPDSSPTDKLPIDNGQAWIESRLIDLLHESRGSKDNPPLYDACIFALFLSTYKLSTGIWEGCFIPEFCASQVLGFVTQATTDMMEPSKQDRESILWLLFVAGGLAQRSRTKSRASALISRLYYWDRVLEEQQQHAETWEHIRDTLKKFIWCRYSMEQKMVHFWKQLSRLAPTHS
ncbi:hypothetical protein K504DRAFT_487022 [Pleomassaria siparia CBS 279.74]|uniref:Transcription factor domain-containing protein n=1 Tax=Pleomassaria siparia CBS 279.74 TaxID=1314801 RepID=A0A6G1KRR9_9PLEO|nr:hypothetical protein K504DRAFT_487022 [Pleomassaria siparia CBS 279.74]